MSKFEHTPGPWEKEKCPCEGIFCNSYFLSVARDGRFSEADANLAIAAPEMLEALIFLYSYILEAGFAKHEKIECILEKATGLPIEEILK